MHFADILNNTLSLVLLIALGIAFITLAVYYGLFYFRVGRWKNSRVPSPESVSDKNLPSVSVVLVAHNEGDYLRENLMYLLEQEYPDFEVIVVNYLSTDDTRFVLHVCADTYPHLKVISLNEDVNFFSGKGKKYPISIGIRSAKNDVILLTEPDSVPKNFGWIRAMMAGYMHNADIVMGFNQLKPGKGMLNTLMQYDHLTTSAHCYGRFLQGKPYTANGRNLSFKRHFFFERGAFTRHYTVPEGADDLFVNQNANKRNTEVVLHPDSLVLTEPLRSFSAWRRMRKSRYASKRYYGLNDLLSLAVHPLAVALFYAAGIFFVFQGLLPLIIFASAMVLLWGWHIVSMSMVCKRLEAQKIHWFAPALEIYFLFANTISMSVALLRRK